MVFCLRVTSLVLHSIRDMFIVAYSEYDIQMNRPIQRLVMPNPIPQGASLTAPPSDPRYHMWRSEPNIHVAAQQARSGSHHQQLNPGTAQSHQANITSPPIENYGNFDHNFDAIVSMQNQFQGNQQINYQNNYQAQSRQPANHGSVVSNLSLEF